MRLIILVSGSWNDIGELEKKEIQIFPYFFDCNSGKGYDLNTVSQLSTTRLLCFTKDAKRDKNTENLEQVLKDLYNCFEEIVIGTHTRTDPPNVAIDVDAFSKNYLKCKFVNYATSLPEFGFLTEFCQGLASSSLNLTYLQNSFDKLFGELKKKHELTHARRLSIFKHRLAHLFLPLHIDFQALQEITDESKRKEYAEEIIGEYQERGYRYLQLLADLQFLLTKTNGITLNNGTMVSISLSDEDLPEGKCVKELVEEIGFQDDQLKGLCESLGFNENTWKPNSDAPIVKFFQTLDEAVISNSPNSSDRFLEAIKGEINNKDFDQWFVQWFTQLEELLDQLEEMTIRNES